MRWFEGKGGSLRYEVRYGQGPYLVLIHEMGGSIESWDQVIAHLPPSQGVVVPEMRGMGFSEKIKETPRFSDIAGDVVSLLDYLGIYDPVVISGCAVGGGVAVRFALNYPKRTAALAPLGPAMDVADTARIGVLALADRMEVEGMRAVEPLLLDRTYPQLYRDRNPGHFSLVRGRWYANDPVSFSHFFRMLVSTNLVPELSALSCPVFFGAGIQDSFRPPEYVRNVAQYVCGAKVVEIDAGHHIADHAPCAVAKLLTDLVEKIS
ncbi:alpha/beta fold hydrolase [Halomonas sp. HK25]|uniref:alpha/beta fold hydrolase n=1 Tax=Halomonas sp. HK25 TaxID=3394321 RepID=UPI0039FD6AF5